MIKDRRSFIKLAGFTSSALLSGKLILPDIQQSIESSLESIVNLSTAEIARDKRFWKKIRKAYGVSKELINLNNGGVAPSPLVVQEAVERYGRFSNEIPSYNMWRILDKGREPLRSKLAELADCDKEEIAIQRNSSESIETVIFGLPLKKGDEVILSKQDYPNMMNAWKQREKRDGIVLKWLDFTFPNENDDIIVDAYRDAITEKTKIIHVTHVINWNGHIMPAKRLAQLAHSNGIEILLDAAHSFAHFQYSLKDLDVDYMGTSLHKWLSAPIGSGMLYIKKGKIKNVYPLLAAADPYSDDIRKFEALGTRSFPIEQGIGQAINFHKMIGADRKEARLHYLKSYWTQAVKDFEGVSLGTSLDPRFSCAIALLQIADIKPTVIANRLLKEFKIHSVAIDYNNVIGVRITPNVYTLTSELDQLIDAVKIISKN